MAESYHADGALFVEQFLLIQCVTDIMRCEIFCRVIDNFGDVGVCWRLAKQLTDRYQIAVSLWTDDLGTLARLVPAVNTQASEQTIEGVLLKHWGDCFEAVCEADVVIEAFACELPRGYLLSMSHLSKPPVWINLEYLSAESWVEACHGQTSIHPTLSLRKYFFFPGFSRKTGGLLWSPPPDRDPLFWEHLGFERAFPGLSLSLFCYDHFPVHTMHQLLMAWAKSELPIRCLVPPGKPSQMVTSALASPDQEQWRAGGGVAHVGNLSLIPIPFLPQDDYDRLLALCDLNFVRGEDSFVRAQWAGIPFCWQIYPQEDMAHELKLDAFLHRYCQSLSTNASASFQNLHRIWNGQDNAHLSVSEAWGTFAECLPELSFYAKKWANRCQQHPDLVEELVRFCTEKI